MPKIYSKEVYLTIDDCPSYDFKNKIDYLKKNNIKANLFCLGKNLEKYPDLAIYALENGYEIYNHSYSHKRFSKLSINEIKQEILKTNKIIEGLYKKANKIQTKKIFRYPYGDKLFFNPIKRKKIEKFLLENNYKKQKINDLRFNLLNLLFPSYDYYWTINTFDYKDIDTNKMIKKIDKKLNKNKTKSEIVLLHDHNNNKYFYEIIDLIKKKEIETKEFR